MITISSRKNIIAVTDKTLLRAITKYSFRYGQLGSFLISSSSAARLDLSKKHQSCLHTIYTLLEKVLILSGLMLAPFEASAQFTGTLDLNPTDCEKVGICTLTYDLKFRDPWGIDWQANAKNKTDGASIPGWAQPIVGKPFDPMYLKAAIIHDHYCDRHVRPWRQTHRVFYYALLESGVPVAKAKLLYYAVYLGGPKWVTLIKGNNCGGATCINTFSTNGSILKVEKPHYDAPEFAEEIATVKAILERDEKSLSLEDLDSRAQIKKPGFYFYSRGDIVKVNDIQITE